jgi:hypothetical protein
VVIPLIKESTITLVAATRQQITLTPGVGMVILLVTSGSCHIGDAVVESAGPQAGCERGTGQTLVFYVADESADGVWLISAAGATVRQLEYSRPH